MIKRLILYVTSLAVVIGLMVSGSSYAWFASSEKREQSISVSVVSNVLSANLSDLLAPENTIIMQGDNLVNLDGNSATLQLENNSTTDTQVRVSIEYTSYSSGNARQEIYSASEDDDIVVEFASDSWAKDVNIGGVCYFYYVGQSYGSDTVTDFDNLPVISSLTGKVPVISKIYYKDDIPYSYSGQKINVKVTFESKQAENVTWSSIDTYDISGVSN